jgi:hypothetical protein
MNNAKPAFFKKEDGHIMFQSKGAKNRYVSCERKTPLSMAVANKIVIKELKKGNHLYFYRCNICGFCHLTHIPQ